LIIKVGIPFSLAISNTPAPGTLHTINETLIGAAVVDKVPEPFDPALALAPPSSKYSIIFLALLPAPEAKIAI